MKPGLLARWRSASMAHRFALAAAGLAAAAVLLISLASWWLIHLAQQKSLQQLAATQRQFRAETVGNDLEALADRMAEVAGSTILATGLVDSAGRETYLAPFLAGIRQINGVPVEVLFTDFEGKEIASNGAARFSEQQLAWLRGELEAGRSSAAIFGNDSKSSELVALAPLRYARTSSPEGALFYRIRLNDLQRDDGLVLEWGAAADGASSEVTGRVPVPEVFDKLGFRISSRTPPATRLADVAPHYLAILLIAAFVFGAVVLAGAKVAKVVTRDLERLQDFSSRFAGSGSGRHKRAAESGSREVASVASSINRMLDRLDEQHSALLLEREKLSQLTEALRVADRRKDDFLAMLAHELRNPLAPIMTGAELLKRAPDPDPRVLRTSEIIARQARHMREILDDLLDMSRVTRGQITLDIAVHEFAGIVAMAVEQVRPLIEENRHSLQCDIPDKPMFVRGDRARLIQIFSNLLTNAAKYTPPGGSIAVRVEPGESGVSTVVQDNGDGIPAELMPEIFQLFTQGARSADRKQGGLGLGLALVKRLVALHGGNIEVESGGTGKGAAFTVLLPLQQPETTVPVAPAPAAAQHGGGLRVMVVDDNADAAESLAAVLELHGHSISIAHDGAAALQLLEDIEVDVFLLDIGLPGLTGYELAQALRARRQTRTARLIAITGYGQPDDKDKAAAAGFDQHLVKPIDTAELLALLRTVVPPQVEPV
ncbi:ATP-binding protein [Piscinibacter sakaiensis]|uniref:hybrid sensor histidine kinase/response regulator n=1 Tax=Piscinibacter sakaiensis TaxID=1547922 RepID=UPI003AAB93C3